MVASVAGPSSPLRIVVPRPDLNGRTGILSSHIRFGDARTFRDLARIIAGERSAYQGFPVITR